MMKSRTQLALGDAPAVALPDATAGGFRWVILLVVWTVFMLSCVDRFAWASIAAPVGHALGFRLALLGSLTTAFYVGYTVSCPVGGILADKFGSRATLAISMFPLGVLTFCFGFVQTFWMAIVLHLLMGFAAGAEYGATVKILTVWFGKDKGRAFGIWTTGTSISVVVVNATVPRITEIYDWQTAYRMLGIATLVISLICLFVVRNTPDGKSVPRITSSQIAELLKNRNLLLLALGGAGALYGTLGFVAWANALMTVAHGVSPVIAGSVLVWFGVGAFVSKPLFGWLYDKVIDYARLVAIGDLLLFIVLLIAFGHCQSIFAYYVLAPFLGAVAYGCTPLLIGLYTQASGPQLAGAAAGFVNAVWSVGSFISPIVAGYVFQHGRSLNSTLGVIAIGPLLGAILLCFVRKHEAAEA